MPTSKSNSVSGSKSTATSTSAPEYKLAARQMHQVPSTSASTVVRISPTLGVGGRDVVIAAGPCAVEGRDMLLASARAVRAAGAALLRGGAFKPRTSPYAFQGMGEDGLRLLAEVRAMTGMPIVTEVMDTRQVARVAEIADVVQVGARNMQNFPLLAELGRCGKPVLLKRGASARITELLLAAEYVMSNGNEAVILCERGIRTFETSTRNTLDISAVPVLKRETHLPVIVDPSHAGGRADLVAPLALAAIAAGADGLIVEVHPDPMNASSDAEQQLTFIQFADLMRRISLVATASGRGVHVSCDETRLESSTATDAMGSSRSSLTSIEPWQCATTAGLTLP
jgi:3-deoxy-7-phosphoheptulonate synthase